MADFIRGTINVGTGYGDIIPVRSGPWTGAPHAADV